MKEDTNWFRVFFFLKPKNGTLAEFVSNSMRKSDLAIYIPQQIMRDRVAWTRSTDENYNLETGYHMW